MKIQIKVHDKNIKLPEYATPGSAAMDLRACIAEEIHIEPGKQKIIKTGVSIYIEDKSYAAMILPRSGLGSYGLVLGNLVGLIDSDYQGELMINLWNRSDYLTHKIKPYDKIAQLVIVPVVQANFELVDEFSNISERGNGGFGSTGNA